MTDAEARKATARRKVKRRREMVSGGERLRRICPACYALFGRLLREEKCRDHPRAWPIG